MVKQSRITGFDIARAIAIFGMVVVNYNVVLGDQANTSTLGRILNEFSGNASATFVILAGMGLTLMAYKPQYAPVERQKIRQTIFRRSLFLFLLGLVFYPIWPADILHFYAEYMHIGILVLFSANRTLVWVALGIMLVFPAITLVLDYNTGWNWATFVYTDFWTPLGFLRNVFFNGWNPVFPWAGFYVFGMWLGRLDWQNPKIRKYLWTGALAGIECTEIITRMGKHSLSKTDAWYPLIDITTQVRPLPLFVVSAASISTVIILASVWLGQRFRESLLLEAIARTGQLSLTHYLAHILIGIILFLTVFHPEIQEQDDLLTKTPYTPLFISLYVCASFTMMTIFSWFWRENHKYGPLEMWMRRITG